MKGRFASGSTGLGTGVVSGRSLVPSPPASTTACTRKRLLALRQRLARGRDSSPPDSLVDEAGRAHGLVVEQVAAVDDHRVGHATADLGEIELAELRPLGH